MTYIGRFFKWSFQWIIGTVIGVIKMGITWVIRQVISIVRFALPYVFRTIGSVLWILSQMMVMNLIALIRPIPDVARKAAEDWAEAAVRDGRFPSLHQLTLVKILYVVAILAMTVGLIANVCMVLFTGVLLWEHGDWLLSLF